MRREGVCIVARTHRYESSAFRLGEPLAEALRGRRIHATFQPVATQAADRSRYSMHAHMEYRDLRMRWWHQLVMEESGPRFSLHSYPYTEGPKREHGGSRKIGELPVPGGTSGVYISDRTGLAARVGAAPVATMRSILRLWKNGFSIWEDASPFHFYVIAVPAVPATSGKYIDERTGKVLDVDLHKTAELGLMGDEVIGILANEIGRITAALQK